MRRALPALVLALAACGSTGSTDAEKDSQQDRSPRDQMRYEQAVAEGRILYGMSKAEVTQAWGQPARTRRVMFRGRKRENWVYAFSDIYFDEGGFVTGYSTAGG
ncbi:MAG: hypothetical protein OER88_01655 [Planctomycetota bacterium]|nr:hypothetical protein [Planctomycetota bacterium]